ncbi:hypothetical protein V6Z11_A04G117500 [Gossypium hirsutum]
MDKALFFIVVEPLVLHGPCIPCAGSFLPLPSSIETTLWHVLGRIVFFSTIIGSLPSQWIDFKPLGPRIHFSTQPFNTVGPFTPLVPILLWSTFNLSFIT